jgi:hypothetical protein
MPNQSNLKAWAAIDPLSYCRSSSQAPGQYVGTGGKMWSCLHRWSHSKEIWCEKLAEPIFNSLWQIHTFGASYNAFASYGQIKDFCASTIVLIVFTYFTPQLLSFSATDCVKLINRYRVLHRNAFFMAKGVTFYSNEVMCICFLVMYASKVQCDDFIVTLLIDSCCILFARYQQFYYHQ